MSTDSFVHLHLHTEFSALDGAVRIPQLVRRAQEFGMAAVAITDHGNMFGAVEFYQECRKGGIKPIIGCEVYVAPGSHLDRKAASQRDSSYHFTLLAENAAGYRNLVRLVSKAHLDGFYYKPRIDKELLAEHSEGLIGLSGCIKSEVSNALLLEDYAGAKKLAARYMEILGRENYFIELHDHGLEAQKRINPSLIRLSKELDLRLVAANDVHFLDREDHDAHDVLICIGTGANVADEKRLRYVPEVYFKAPTEMRALFREHPEACDHTLLIAERCGFELDATAKYPNYTPPEGMMQNEYLRSIVAEGLGKRFGGEADSAAIQERLELEIGVLEKQGFVNYFLIVWDFINWAKEQGIPVGPGRGSAAGSLVAYAMGITDIDPLRFKLLFERFLNPERVSPPDIDVDFCQNRRGEVIDYVRRKYGDRAVAQIITFGTLGAKSVVRDVGRVMGWGYGDADRLAKMIPNELGITLAGFDKKNKETGAIEHVDGAIDKNPELAAAVKNEPATADLWEKAVKLEGLTRGTGVHAAGVVIGDRDLSEYIPLTRANDGSIVSQYAMGPLTDVGMLKCDFLGLKTLTVISDAVALIHQHTPDFRIEGIPLDDQATFDMLNRGETVAVFQLESGGMVSVCRQFDISDIEDINAILALYRPGPMELIPEYIKRKKGVQKVKAPHPLLLPITKETYGVLVYQEQVMQAAQIMAGYTLGGADLLRRAMGKKDKEKMAKEREKFIEGAAKLHRIKAETANEVFDTLEKFAGYGFNRSHSAAYAWVSYQTAYLKANYPVEFMAAVMSNEVSNTEKISAFVAECERLGIRILPPDLNRSGLKFEPAEIRAEGIAALKALRRPLPAVEPESADSEAGAADAGGKKGHAKGKKNGGFVAGAQAAELRKPELGAIRYGLAAIKNVGEAAMEAAMAERANGGPFGSLADFCRRVDSRKISRKVVECLVKCGAFDFTGGERAQLFAEIEGAMAAAASLHRDRASGQSSLFDMLEADPPAPEGGAIRAEPWPATEKLAYEKELLGFYVTGHPLDEYRSLLEGGKYVPIALLTNCEDKGTVSIAGALVSVEKKFTRKDSKPFAVVVLEDLTDQLEVMVWNEAFTRAQAHLIQGAVVAITGRLSVRDEGVRIGADEVKPLKKPLQRNSPVVLTFEREKVREEDLYEVKRTVESSPGSSRLEFVFVAQSGQRLRLAAGDEFNVNLTPEIRERLLPWLR